MAVIKDRPLSETQANALAALSRYGYIAEPAGSWANLPHGAMVPQRTRDALLRRGIGRKSVVIVGNSKAPWPALLAFGTTEPVTIPVPEAEPSVLNLVLLEVMDSNVGLVLRNHPDARVRNAVYEWEQIHG